MRLEAFTEAVARRRRFMKTVQGRAPRKLRKFRKQTYPKAIELSYLSQLLQPLKRLEEAVKRELFTMLPALASEAARLKKADAWREDAPSRAKPVLEGLRITAKAIFSDPNIEAVAERVGEATSEHQKRELGRQIQTALGVQVPLNDPKLRDRLEAWTTENVALVQDVPEEMLNQIERRLYSGLNAGSRWEEIAKDLQDRMGIAENRAALIARDQVGKFYAAVQEARQQDLGVTHYFWRGEMDNRERDEHVLREGERFAWSDPPEDGHPGEPINCRCTADPDLEQVLQNLEEK